MEKKLHLSGSTDIISILEDKESHMNPVLVRATVSSLRNVWWLATAFALFALLLAAFTCDRGLGIRVTAQSDSVSLEKDVSSESSMISKEQV